MPMLTEITTIEECLIYLEETDADAAALASITILKQAAERAVRSHVGTGITQATYTHYLPLAGVRPSEILRLPEYPLRSITSLHLDLDGYAGFGASAFAAVDLLVSGTDYYPLLNQSGLSWFGHVMRIGGAPWPKTPGSIKIVYSAGWSALELAGEVTDPGLDASDIQLAVFKTLADIKNAVDVQRSNSGPGGITSESLEGWSASYDSTIATGVNLSEDVKETLKRFCRMVAN